MPLAGDEHVPPISDDKVVPEYKGNIPFRGQLHIWCPRTKHRAEVGCPSLSCPQTKHYLRAVFDPQPKTHQSKLSCQICLPFWKGAIALLPLL